METSQETPPAFLSPHFKLYVASLIGYLLIAGLYVGQFYHDTMMAKLSALYLIVWLPFLAFKTQRPLSRPENIFIGLCVFYFITMLPAYFISIDVNKANGELEKLAKWTVIAPSLIFILHRIRISTGALLSIFVLAAIPISGWVIYDQVNHFGERSWSYGNPNIAGYIISGLIAVLAGILPQYRYKWLVFMAILALLFALIGTETRGAWISLPIIALCQFKPVWRKFVKAPRLYQLISITLVTGLLVSAAMTPQIQKRAETTYKNITRYIESPETKGFTSLGVRLELYHASWEMAKDYPLTGVGLGDVKYYILEYDRYFHIINDVGFSFSAHSEYFQSMAFRGFVNFFTYLFILAWLIHYYLRSKPHDTEEINAFQRAGLAFNLTTAVVCLTLSMLSNNTGLNVFIMSNAILIFLIERQRTAIRAN